MSKTLEELKTAQEPNKPQSKGEGVKSVQKGLLREGECAVDDNGSDSLKDKI